MRKSFAGSMKDSGMDDSIHSFMTQQLGERFANKIGASVIRGIFAGDSKKLSMRDCFAPMYTYFKDSNQPSFLRGIIWNVLHPQKAQEESKNKTLAATDDSDPLRNGGSFSFKRGIQELPNGIVASMQDKYKENFEILCGTQISDVQAEKDCLKVSLSSESGSNSIDADHMICTLPSFATAKLLALENNKLSALLDSIHYVDVAVITLMWNTKIDTGYNGFGYLVSPETPAKILGTTFDR